MPRTLPTRTTCLRLALALLCARAAVGAQGAAQVVLQDPRHSLAVEVSAERIAARTLGIDGAPAAVSIRTTRFGREGTAPALPPGRLHDAGERARIARAGIEEWLVVHAQGFEHGWTIAEPPAEDGRALWIGLAFDGLSPRISEDGLCVRLADARGRTRLYYRHLSAHDADGRSLAARLAVVEGEIGIRVRDAGARYPVTVDPILSTVLWAFESNQTGAQLGPCNTAGDVNNDGYSDVLAGAPFENGGGQSRGVARLFLGSPSGPGLAPVWTSSGPNQNVANFGAVLCSLGDVNADGYDDFAVGAPNYDNGSTDEGAVFVYAGGPSGTPTLLWTIEGNTTGLQLGYVFHAGDIDSDGFSDVLVSSISSTVNGEVRLYLGSASPALPAVFWAPTAASLGVPAADFRNIHVAGAGDVDRDGYDDVLLGLPIASGGDGRAFLFWGGTTAPLTNSTWSPSDPVGAAGEFGGPVRPAGDVDGNGFADVYVGAPQTVSGRGRVYLYLSDGASNPTTFLPAAADQSFTGGSATPPSELAGGTGSLFAGDVNGDGFGDLCVGEPGHTSGNGRVRLYLGSPSGLAVPPEFLSGTVAGMALGRHAGTAGDVDGDGFNDVLFGAPRFDNPELDEGEVMLCSGAGGSSTLLNTPDAGADEIVGSGSSALGSALALSGTGNGDGFEDLLVGSPYHDNGESDEGQVRLYLGGDVTPAGTGLATTPAWSFESDSAGARLGAAVCWAGDVNGDGRSDVLIGAPGLSNGQTGEGRVLLFLGTASGVLAGTPAWTYESNEASAELGAAVASAGDIDGDGLCDVVVGAPGTHLGGANRGAVYVFRGRRTTQGLPAVPDLTLDGPAGSSRFGAAVTGVFDVNRDGFSDVVVGSPEYGNGQAGEGRVQLFTGSASGLSISASWSYETNLADTDFGRAVANAGDVDGDGRGDLVVGAPTQDAATIGGKVHVFLASTLVTGFLSPSALQVGQANAEFGAAVAFAGDVDGDGWSDVAVGAPLYDDGASNGGKVWLYLGSSSGLSPVAGASVAGTAANENCGSAIAGAGDTDGDGQSDLVAGSGGWSSGNGRVRVYDGGTSSGPIHAPQQRRAYDASAVSLLGLSDSTDSFLLGASVQSYASIGGSVGGSCDVKLEWELKPLSSALDGTALDRSASYADPLLVSDLAETVNGLAIDVDYVWRLRIATNNPLCPESPWLLLQGNGWRERKLSTGLDCNGNDVADAFDILNATSTDLDENGVPDDCQPLLAFCSPLSALVMDCPCGNAPAGAGQGCANSLGAGASIGGSGTASLSADTLVVSASGIGSSGASCAGAQTSLTCILLQGNALNSAGTAFNDGVRCFAGTLKRLQTASSAGGVLASTVVISTTSAGLGDSILAGSKRWYGVWYRDACASWGCTNVNSNVSNTLQVEWTP